MQHFPKDRALIAFVIAGLIVCSFMLLVTRNNITNVSAVEANGVGVYWDSDCRDIVSSIDWGSLKPGSAKNIIVYIRNEKEEPIFLTKSTMNWKPSIASKYITLKWDYRGWSIDPGEVLQVTLTLSISSSIEGIWNFGFDIVISQSIPGDVNFDGIVDIEDVVIVVVAFGSRPGQANWNPIADLNGDGIIDISDIVLVTMNLE